MHPAFNKILIISSEFPPNVGGIGNHAYNLAKAFAGERFEVSVMADIIDVNEKELTDLAEKEDFKISWIKRKRFVIQTYLLRIFKAVVLSKKAERIILSGKFSLWLGIIIRLIYPKKQLIAVVHGTELDLKSPFSKKVTSYSLSKCNKIISVSTYTSQFLPKSLPAAIQQFIIHNGINCKEFSVNNFSGLTGDPALITVGNVTDRKGQENVINALPEILYYYPEAKYHIVGKPTNKENIQKRAVALNIEDKLIVYGAVSRIELLRKLKGSGIKLMLSDHTREGDFEGFGIAVLEANAFGVPAIGSRNSGIADAIEDNKTGLLVDQHNSKEVADAVKTIMGNYSYFSKNAKLWAIQHDWKIIVKQYIAAINA